MPQLLGTNPEQVPVCGMLGTLAFQDNNAVQITGGKIGGVDVAAIASAVLTGEETDTINSSANLVLRGGGVNLLTWSEDFSNSSAWAVSAGVSVTVNTAVGPDGVLSADTLTGASNLTTTGSAVNIRRSTTVTAAATYTFSVWVKRVDASATQIGLIARDATVGSNFPAVFHYPSNDDWVRLSITFTMGAASTSCIVYIGAEIGSFYIFGAQLVPGTSPGPYTKTTAQAITSAAPALIDAPNGMAEALPSSVTPPRNGDMVIEATSNTTLTFKLRGTDGTVRSGTLTLA